MSSGLLQTSDLIKLMTWGDLSSKALGRRVAAAETLRACINALCTELLGLSQILQAQTRA